MMSEKITCQLGNLIFIINFVQQLIKIMKHSNVSYSEMCESMNFNTHDVSSDENSSEYKVNIIGLRHLPRCLSRQFSDINDSFSIDQFNSNSHKHPEVFKCFKCYGIVQNKQAPPNKKCRQCQGTSFVTDSHPLVSLLEQIICKQVPEIASSQQNSKKRKLNRRQTIERQYAFPDTIKEESFSMQEEQLPACKSCFKQCQNNYHKCDRCPNYYICLTCFSKSNFYHHHRLYPKEVSMMIGGLNPYTLKKISQQVQSLQDTSSKCSNCKKRVEACFVCCTTCAAKGIQFNLCDYCYQNNSYHHQSNHQLTIKTSMYDERVDLDSYNSSMIDFQSSPLFRSQDNLSDLSKKVGSYNNSFMPFQSQIADHGSEIINKAHVSQGSLFQNQLQEISQMPIFNSKLSRSYRCSKELQDQDFSIRYSQNRPETDENKSLQFNNIQEEPQTKWTNPEYQQPKESSRLSKPSHRVDKSQTDRSNPEQYFFKGYQCDICGVSPIVNRKYHCSQCEDYDLCEMCYIDNVSHHKHKDFTLQDGFELLKKQKEFITKSIYEKSIQSSIQLLKTSNRLAQSKSILRRVS